MCNEQEDTRLESLRPDLYSEHRTCPEMQWVDDDKTNRHLFGMGIKRVYGRSELVALAVLELKIPGIALTLSGLQVRKIDANDWPRPTLLHRLAGQDNPEFIR